MLPCEKAREAQIEVWHGGSDGCQQQTRQTRCKPAIFLKPRRNHAPYRQHIRLHRHTDGDEGAKEGKEVEKRRGGKSFQCTHAYERTAEQRDKNAQKVFCLPDLKGRKTKVGVIGLSDSSIMSFKRKLRELGVIAEGPEAEVEFIVYGASDLPLALKKGAVDVIALHDPTAALAEEEYDFKKLLDTAQDPKFAVEYCCIAFVSLKLWKENPEGAAAFTRAVARGSAFVSANPREAARLQLAKDIVTGNIDFNAKLLDTYSHIPSRKATLRTFKRVATELQQTGVLKKKLDIDKFIKAHFADFESKGIKVPDGYAYDLKTDTFKETYEEPKSLARNQNI